MIARFGIPDQSEGRPPVIEIVDDIGLVVVDIQQLDDSIGSERYAVWYSPDADSATVERAYRISNCSRGIAAPDLCV